jgi:hypothetical protein
MKGRADFRPSTHKEKPMRNAACLFVVAALAGAPSAFAQRTTGPWPARLPTRAGPCCRA